MTRFDAEGVGLGKWVRLSGKNVIYLTRVILGATRNELPDYGGLNTAHSKFLILVLLPPSSESGTLNTSKPQAPPFLPGRRHKKALYDAPSPIDGAMGITRVLLVEGTQGGQSERFLSYCRGMRQVRGTITS